MTSQKIHISPIISRSRDNQADIFVKNHAENEMGRLVPDLFFFFFKNKNKSFIQDKTKWSAP